MCLKPSRSPFGSIRRRLTAQNWSNLSGEDGENFSYTTSEIEQIVALTIDQTEPQLIVVLLLHGRHHLAAMLQDVRLLQAGHEVRLDDFPSEKCCIYLNSVGAYGELRLLVGRAYQHALWELAEVYGQAPRQCVRRLRCQFE